MIVGGVLSSMTMVCTQLLELPQSSVARQVRRIVPSCGHPPPVVTSENVSVGVASQLSVAVAVPVVTGVVPVLHWMVTLGGHVICGGLLSMITMVCVQKLVLPQPSVADHVRVIVFKTGHAPGVLTSLKVIVGEATQLSVAVAEPVAAGAVLVLH